MLTFSTCLTIMLRNKLYLSCHVISSCLHAMWCFIFFLRSMRSMRSMRSKRSNKKKNTSKIIINTRKGFLKSLFKSLISHLFQFLFHLLVLFILSYLIRTTTFSCLDASQLDRNYNVCIFLIIVFSTLFSVMYVFNIVRQLVNWIRVPNTRIDWSMHNRQLNDTITVQNCILALAFTTTNYYLTPLFFVVMLFLHYDSDLSTLIMFKDVGPSPSHLLSTLVPSTGATRPLNHPFPPNGQNQKRATVDAMWFFSFSSWRKRKKMTSACKKKSHGMQLEYKIIPNTVQGAHVAIYDRLQPSGERLVELFRTTSMQYNGRQLIRCKLMVYNIRT